MIRPLAWDPPYAAGVALKRWKKKRIPTYEFRGNTNFQYITLGDSIYGSETAEEKENRERINKNQIKNMVNVISIS